MRLPPGWAETIDPKGRKYFYNAATQESLWEPPPGTIMDNVPPAMPPGPPKPPGPPPMRSGPPAMPGGPPAMPGSGPPAMPGSGPPAMPSAGPPPMRAGPPPLSINPSIGSSTSTPAASPANRSGPPPLFGGGPPPPPISPANRTGPPPLGAFPPMIGNTPPASPGGPPALPGGPPPSPGGPPALPPASPANRTGPPPMFGTMPPGGLTVPPPKPAVPLVAPASPPQGQLPSHFQGSPFATAPPAPVSRQPSFNPGAPQVGTLPPGPPPARAPGMSVSGPPPMRAPGMSVSGPPPVLNVTGVQSGALPPMRAPGMSVSGPPPMRAPGMSVSGPPPMLNVTGVQSGAPPPVRAPGMSVSGPPPMRPPGMSVSGPPSTLPMIPPTPTAGTTTLPPQQFSGPLPYPWKETTAANGKTYYYNPVTQATSWTHPGLMGASPQQNAQTLSGAAGGVNQLNSLPQTGEKRFVKEYSGPISLRSGVFKSWEPRYLTIKPQSLFSVWDTEQMKKERIKINATFILAVPINRGDSRNVLAIHEYVKHAPTVISDVKQAKNTYYFDCGTNQLREELLVTLHDQGAVIRRPLFESNAMINKESRFVTVYDHQIEIFKKNTDDEADIILTFGPSTFFQNTPSQFPLLYEEGKVYGSVTPATFVVGTDCNEDQTLYYVTLQLNTNQNDTTGNQDDDAQAMIKKIKEAITQKQTKVDPTSLHEGYLYKASTNLQRWSRRYFILRRDSLTYYRLRGDEKPAGECLLPNGFEIDLHPSTAQYPSPFFVAESGDEDTRQFLMCALNDPEYQSWCDAISTLQQQKQVKKEAGSLKEGYVNLCGKKLTPHRKYVVVSPHNDTVKVYNSRNDPHSAIDIPLPKGAYISEASLPGDDTIGTQRLAILGITNPQTNAEHFFGFSQARDREEWIAVLKSIAGDAVAKSHPDSYCEGYVYKSKKKGSLGSLKYCVITPHALYYTDKKEADVLSQDPQVQKRVKKFEHTGDAVIEEDLTSIPGYRGLLVPSTGDESGGEVVLLYYSDDAAFLKAKNALKQALASVDWRRNPASTFEGYVWKSNTSGKSWAYRYAIVTQEAVSFYKRKFDKDLAGQMPLAGCSFSKHLFADVNSPTVAKEDRTALEYFASQYKSASGSTLGVTAQSAGVTPDQLTIVSIRPNSSDPKAKPIWLGSFLPSDTMQWFQVFNELSSAGKPMHPGSIKEGYLCYGGTTAAHRRYASLYPDRIDLYPSRLDTTLESTFPLAVGFDVLYKDNSLYISKSNHAVDDVLDSSVYAQFSNAVGGEVLSSWLEAFQKAYTSRVGSSSDNVRASLYANISFNKGKQEFKYVILLQDKLCIFSSRSSAFPTPLSSEPVLANAERTLPYIQAGLDVQELGPQRLQVKIYQDTLVFDFRADYEHQSFTEELKAPPGLDHVSSFVHRGTMAMPTPRKMGSPSVSGRVQAFAMSLPPPPQLDDDAPPPPMFLEEEEDAPPPPPPDFDFEEAPPPPAPDSFSSQGSFIPTTNFEFSSPISSVPEASTLPANPSGPREMPLFDDSDDDDIPEFIKEKRRQQAAAAAAAAAAPEPAQTTFISPAAVSSSGFKAPAKAGAGLGLDFEFSFDLPPAPAFDLPPPAADELPPPSAAAVSNYGVTSPTESTVRRPLFGANRAVAPTPAPVVDAKYIPVDFDDDDDDLPPPGA